MAQTRSGKAEYLKLEQRLVLLAWLNGELGYESNRDLLADMKGTPEGFDATGHSYFYHHLEARGDQVRIPLADLARYDDNIRVHMRVMNSRRPDPITLRYFQHLAVLYAEIFLDRYFHRRGELLRSLNGFVQRRNAAKPPTEPKDEKFSLSDLKKLAFWMATGSGKTLMLAAQAKGFSTVPQAFATAYAPTSRSSWASRKPSGSYSAFLSDTPISRPLRTPCGATGGPLDELVKWLE